VTWPSFNLVDPALNWAASFLYNPLFAPFASDAGEMEIQQLSYCYLLFCKIFFVVPIFIAAFLRFGRTTLATLICILASLFAVFVSDPFFWASLHALPAAAFLLVLAQSQRNREGYLLIGAACLWASTAGPLAFVGSLMLAWLARYTPPRKQFLFLSVSLPLSVILLTPYPMPRYPGGARLSIFSPASLWPSPVVGPYLSPNPINYSEFHTRLAAASSVALVVIILLLFLFLLIRRRGDVLEFRAAILIALFIFLDAKLGGKMTLSLASVMYGQALLPSPLILAETALLIVLFQLFSRKTSHSRTVKGAFILVVFIALSGFTQRGAVSTSKAKELGSHFSDYVLKMYEALPEGDIAFSQLATSDIQANSEPSAIRLVLDANEVTIWTSASAMSGDEQVELRFQSPQDCPLLKLHLGKASTDFPRGVAVEVESRDGAWVSALDIPLWNGPIRKTESGASYFGPQGDVVLSLKNSLAISGMKIRQTGKDSHFHWSIAEIQCGQAR